MKRIASTGWLPLILATRTLTSLAAPADQEPWPNVTQAEVQQLLEKSGSDWQRKISGRRPRLYLDADQWEAFQKTINSSAEETERWRTYFFKIADQVAQEPVIGYSPPESKVSPKNSLSEAHQELWQRGVAGDIITLALAARLSDHPAYAKKLHNQVMEACGYPSWGIVFPNQDLACAHMVRAISIAYDWCGDLFSAEEKDVIRRTIGDRAGALLEGLYGKRWWSNRYTENHNHIDASSLGIAGVSFFDELPQAPEWLAAAECNFDRVFHYVNADGSSPEGVPYWSYGMSAILQYIEASRPYTGSDRLYQAAYLRNAVSYRLAVTNPGLRGLPPWGDADNNDFSGPQHILYRFARQYSDSSAQYMADNLPIAPNGGGEIAAFTLLWHDPKIPAVAPESLDFHLSDLDMMTTRSSWGKDGYILALKSGFTNRNHSHLDAGALVFGWGDDWLLKTPGYGRGHTQPGFWQNNLKEGGGRWKFFSNSTESESTLLINNKNQRAFSDSRALIDHYLSSPGQCWTSVDLSGAYDDIQQLKRNVFHRRGDYMLIWDEIRAQEPVSAEWLAQVPPSAEANGATIIIRSKDRGLRITNLGAGTPFEKRRPSSPYVDIPETQQQTYSSRIETKDNHFAVLLEPVSVTGGPPLDASLSTLPGIGRIILRSEEWTDTLCFSQTGDAVEMAVGNEKDSPAATVEARYALWRLRGSTWDTLLSIGSRHWNLSFLKMNSHSSFDAALEQGPNETWILQLSTPFEGTLTLPHSHALYDGSGHRITFAKDPVKLDPGTYLLKQSD